MADIYKVDSGKIVGGPGRLVVKPFDGTYPQRISDVMDLSTPFDLKSGFRDLGATSEGITISRGFETEEFTVDQVSGAVDTDITEWTHSLETNLAENTVENRQLALMGGTIIQTSATTGTATTTTGALAAGATLVNVTSATGFEADSYAQLDGDTYRILAVTGNALTVSPAIKDSIPTSASIAPVTELGTRRIGFGSPSQVPFHTFVLISQKKDGSLYMAVFRKCQISGDDKEQVFGKEKRLLPLQLSAFADGSAAADENVYYEIEQVL